MSDNVQEVPKQVREFFKQASSASIIEMDFAELERRLLAHMTEVEDPYQPITDKYEQLRHMMIGTEMWRDLVFKFRERRLESPGVLKKEWLRNKNIDDYVTYFSCPACRIAGYHVPATQSTHYYSYEQCSYEHCPIKWANGGSCYSVGGEYRQLTDLIDSVKSGWDYKDRTQIINAAMEIYKLHLEAVERIIKEIIKEANDEKKEDT